MTNVEVVREGPFAWIWMNRPERRNALSLEHLQDLLAAFREVGESDARGVVLGGRGPVFSAGHDFGGSRRCRLPDGAGRCSRPAPSCSRRMQVIPQPVVARVHGLATAAGFQLVATADLAVAGRVGRLRGAGWQGRLVLPHADGGGRPGRGPQAGARAGPHR